MTPSWQMVIAAAIVFLAAAFLLRQFWRRITARVNQVGCGSCRHNPANEQSNLVSLDSLASTAEQINREPAKR
ncbi:MAG: hypothetical protein U0872_00850 [Planctomycetaceae bacterium]